MTITFNGIPSTVRVPGVYTEVDNSRAVRGLAGMTHRILVIGQRRTSGTIAALIQKLVSSGAQAEEYFGVGSMLAEMCKAVKKNAPYVELWGLAQDEASGVKASGTLAFTGPATAAGTLHLWVGGVYVPVTVTSGMTATALATAVVAAILAIPSLPVTAASTDGDVTVTCHWKGTTGNKIDLRLNYAQEQRTPAGIACTITAMASGATDPTLSAALAVMGDIQYDTIIFPYSDTTSIAAVETELDTRDGPMVQLGGQAFTSRSDTYGNLVTLGTGRNSRHVSIIGAKSSPTPPWIWAASVGAVDAAEPDPARPRQGLELKGVLPPAEADRFTRAEREILLNDGIATFTVNSGRVQVERLITTYRVNALSVPDISYLDIETMRTLRYLRTDLRSFITSKYPRHKLASDGARFGPGQAVVTPKVIRGEILNRFKQWEEAGLVEGFDQFNDELIVERNGSDPNRLDALIPPDVINQFRVFAGQIQYLL